MAVILVLKTLDMLRRLHGHGMARHIEQISRDMLSVNQGLAIASF
jgi:hypothetical protein